MHPLKSSVLALAIAAFSASSASALNDKYHITSEEQAACLGDATRFCSGAYPDEDRLLVCMKRNYGALSTGCAVVFKAGLKRRHMS